ncbi:hypothetical protein [uncultured Thiodictyon sp.]|jgi:hypothetical protein|uniref:hypothetical protein n=1 Tax=uncultured Thiodictyon sp. TaxID=1846217 RepID=UPI0025E9EE57|nr:hypothetical protein [uncultured Thiodictyon sp.]
MIPNETDQPALPTPRAPDPILAELWEVKRELNRAADYRIDALVQMAHESAERIRQQWRQEGQSAADVGVRSSPQPTELPSLTEP